MANPRSAFRASFARVQGIVLVRHHVTNRMEKSSTFFRVTGRRLKVAPGGHAGGQIFLVRYGQIHSDLALLSRRPCGHTRLHGAEGLKSSAFGPAKAGSVVNDEWRSAPEERALPSCISRDKGGFDGIGGFWELLWPVTATLRKLRGRLEFSLSHPPSG